MFTKILLGLSVCGFGVLNLLSLVYTSESDRTVIDCLPFIFSIVNLAVLFISSDVPKCENSRFKCCRRICLMLCLCLFLISNIASFVMGLILIALENSYATVCILLILSPVTLLLSIVFWLFSYWIEKEETKPLLSDRNDSLVVV